LIIVHRLNNSEFIINANQIETVESTPDTVITLINDKKLIVKETSEEILNAVIAYNRRVFLSAFQAAKEGE
jgi:flagellar protein FlbD